VGGGFSFFRENPPFLKNANMIDCFPTKNYIGIRGDCDGETPESGLYINDLAGITLKLAASSATEEDVRGIDMLRRLETLAIDLAASGS
jgi:hypothetical protein